MIARIRPTIRSAMGQVLIDAMDAGSGPARIRFYTAPMPAAVTDAITTQTLLAEMICSDPAASVTNGIITFSAVSPDMAADADGTVTWARLLDSDGNAVADFDVTNAEGNGAILINNVNILENGVVQMLAFQMPIGA